VQGRTRSLSNHPMSRLNAIVLVELFSRWPEVQLTKDLSIKPPEMERLASHLQPTSIAIVDKDTKVEFLHNDWLKSCPASPFPWQGICKADDGSSLVQA